MKWTTIITKNGKNKHHHRHIFCNQHKIKNILVYCSFCVWLNIYVATTKEIFVIIITRFVINNNKKREASIKKAIFIYKLEWWWESNQNLFVVDFQPYITNQAKKKLYTSQKRLNFVRVFSSHLLLTFFSGKRKLLRVI